MFKHIILFALRDIWNNKLYSALSVVGLGVAITSALFMLLYAKDNLSWDKHWKKKESLYRFTSFRYIEGNQNPEIGRVTPPAAKDALLRYFPDEIKRVTRLHELYRGAFFYKGREYDQILVMADPDIVDMFDFDVLYGDLRASINDVNKIALSDSLANRIFGRLDVVGESLFTTSRSFERNYTVGAVYRDPNTESAPATTVWMPMLAKIDVAYLSSLSEYFHSWDNYSLTQTFLELKEGVDKDSIEIRMPEFLNENAEGFYNPLGGKYSDHNKWLLTSIKDTHLGSGSWSVTRYEEVYGVIIVAYMIITLACINFMNLTVARLSVRAREAALRKVMGASKGILVAQLMVEVSIVLVMGLILGLAGFELFSPYMADFFREAAVFDYTNPLNYLILLWIFLPALLISSVYPALLFSWFSPSEMLRVNRSGERKMFVSLRKYLVVFQLVVSTSLISVCSVMFVQLNYGLYKGRIGDIDNIYYFPTSGSQSEKNLKYLLEDIPKFQSVGNSVKSFFLPFYPNQNLTKYALIKDVDKEKINSNDVVVVKEVSMRDIIVADGFFEFFEIPLLAGRVFNSDGEDDYMRFADGANGNDLHVQKIVINESALSLVNVDTAVRAIGKRLVTFSTVFEVVGVVPNAGLLSLRKREPPIAYIYDPKRIDNSTYSMLLFKPKNTIEEFREEYVNFFKTKSEADLTNYYFPPARSVKWRSRAVLNDLFFMSRVMLAMTVAVVFVAALGMVGLTKLSVSRRLKEIGMRKVLGATSAQIAMLFLKQSTNSVFIASIVACFVSYITMSGWLLGFSYRISIVSVLPASIFACFVSLLITWLTVGGIAIGAARAKPIETLRYE